MLMIGPDTCETGSLSELGLHHPRSSRPTLARIPRCRHLYRYGLLSHPLTVNQETTCASYGCCRGGRRGEEGWEERETVGCYHAQRCFAIYCGQGGYWGIECEHSAEFRKSDSYAFFAVVRERIELLSNLALCAVCTMYV